jgi:enoyl-CoA hydratase/carnithine racemase
MAIRITHRASKIGFVFARRGLVMEAASSFFLPRLIGHSRAMHLVTTGAVYAASDRLLEGLFSEVLDEPGEVLPRALEVAEEVAGKTSVVSWAVMRDLMWRGPGSAEEAHLLDSRITWEQFGSKDNEEGVRSFLEKRPAKFEATMSSDAPDTWPWWAPVTTIPRAKGKVEGSKL